VRADEAQNQAFAHAGVVHAGMLKAMHEDQGAQVAKAVEASIKPGTVQVMP